MSSRQAQEIQELRYIKRVVEWGKVIDRIKNGDVTAEQLAEEYVLSDYTSRRTQKSSGDE